MRLHELLVVQAAQTQQCVDRVVGLDVEHVLDGATLEVLVALGYLVALEPVAAALACEEQHGLVHRSRVDIFGEVLLACACSLRTYAAARLLAELAERCALDVAQVRYGDDNRVVRVEVFGVELVLVRLDLRAALVAVLLLHLLQVVLHHLLAKLRVAENLLEVGNLTLQLLKLGVQLVDAQAGELREAHVDDGFRLQFVEVEALLEVALSVGRSLGSTDDAHNLVDVVAGDNQAFEDMGTLLSLLEVVLCAAYGDVVTVLYEILNALLKREQTRATVDKRNAVDRE